MIRRLICGIRGHLWTPWAPISTVPGLEWWRSGPHVRTCVRCSVEEVRFRHEQ